MHRNGCGITRLPPLIPVDPNIGCILFMRRRLFIHRPQLAYILYVILYPEHIWFDSACSQCEQLHNKKRLYALSDLAVVDLTPTLLGQGRSTSGVFSAISPGRGWEWHSPRRIHSRQLKVTSSYAFVVTTAFKFPCCIWCPLIYTSLFYVNEGLLEPVNLFIIFFFIFYWFQCPPLQKTLSINKFLYHVSPGTEPSHFFTF